MLKKSPISQDGCNSRAKYSATSWPYKAIDPHGVSSIVVIWLVVIFGLQIQNKNSISLTCQLPRWFVTQNHLWICPWKLSGKGQTLSKHTWQVIERTIFLSPSITEAYLSSTLLALLRCYIKNPAASKGNIKPEMNLMWILPYLWPFIV